MPVSPSDQPLYNDNSVPFGSIIANIGGTDYILESITVTLPTKFIERHDEKGGPNGWVAVRQNETASAVLQVPVEDAFPALGDYFSQSLGGSVASRWVIIDMGVPYEINSYRKVNITLRGSENPT